MINITEKDADEICKYLREWLVVSNNVKKENETVLANKEKLLSRFDDFQSMLKKAGVKDDHTKEGLVDYIKDRIEHADKEIKRIEGFLEILTVGSTVES